MIVVWLQIVVLYIKVLATWIWYKSLPKRYQRPKCLRDRCQRCRTSIFLTDPCHLNLWGRNLSPWSDWICSKVMKWARLQAIFIYDSNYLETGEALSEVKLYWTIMHYMIWVRAWNTDIISIHNLLCQCLFFQTETSLLLPYLITKYHHRKTLSYKHY